MHLVASTAPVAVKCRAMDPVNTVEIFPVYVAMLVESLVTTTWHVLRLQMEVMASRYGG
jgi:hypothetical protein